MHVRRSPRLNRILSTSVLIAETEVVVSGAIGRERNLCFEARTVSCRVAAVKILGYSPRRLVAFEVFCGSPSGRSRFCHRPR